MMMGERGGKKWRKIVDWKKIFEEFQDFQLIEIEFLRRKICAVGKFVVWNLISIKWNETYFFKNLDFDKFTALQWAFKVKLWFFVISWML